MALVRWDPFRDLVSIQERMNRLFDDTLSRHGSEESFFTTWAPPVDIVEKEKEIVLYAELPGLNKEDIKLEIKDNILTLSGERKMEKEVNEENYHRVERAYGRFARSFTLPYNIKSGAVNANYKNGVLTVVLPKADESKSKQISIREK